MKKMGFLLFTLLAITVSGQRDAMYYQYLFNYHIINPAFTGTQEKLVMTLTDRHQWVGVNGAPNTITFGAHSLVKNEKIGIGGYVYTDRLGPWTDFGLLSTYSYIINLEDDGRLSFGLQFGFKQSRIDWDKLFMEHMDDIYLIIREQPSIMPDANFGVYYYTKTFFAGISTKHLFERYFVEWGKVKGDNFSTLRRHIYFYTGNFFKIRHNLVFKPSVLIKYVDNGTFCYDLNSSLLINNTIWFGVSYRSNKRSFVFLTEFKASSKLKIGYSYDTYMGDIKDYNIGSHEFKLSYDIMTLNKRPYVPVYF